MKNQLFRLYLTTFLSVCMCLPSYAESLFPSSSTVPSAIAKNALPLFARSSEHIYNLPGLSNTGKVAPGIYRGALPDKSGYKTLKQLGVKTVIDMRTTGSEKADVENAGMKSISIPIEMSRNGLHAKVEQVIALMADPSNQPVYVHCRHGQDRTGIVIAAYRMKMQNWSLSDAETEMQAFGFNDVWINFKQFIRKYGKEIEDSKKNSKGV